MAKVAHSETTYGLMGLIKGTTPRVERETEEEMVMTWPHLVYRELIALMGFLIVLLAMSILFNAPLEEIANPAVTPNPAKAPWYFLGLQELLHYAHPLLAGIILPTLVIVALVALPYLDRNPSTRFRDRRTGIIVWTILLLIAIILTIIGTFFRGPNWQWQWPWAA